MKVTLPSARTFVTGGAGFIGGELVETLLEDGGTVTVFDDLSSAEPDWRTRFRGDARLTFIRGDAADPAAVAMAMPGHDRVVHLASGTDIAGGHGHPERDFVSGIVATEVVCDAMRQLGIDELWYASSGVVYGSPPRIPTAEGDGPFLPASHYAAAKLAGEAIVSGFAHLYGWRTLAFRFGNTVGRRSNHGVVHDFVVKLIRDATQLEILGDGTQAKPYVAVSDLVAGMRHAAATVTARPVTVLNVGPEGTLTVRRVAEIVSEALDLARGAVQHTFTGRSAMGGGGWPGDTAHVAFDTSALRALGWRPKLSQEEAVRDAASGIAKRYRTAGRPLMTAAERRAAPPVAVGPRIG
ncbi:MAG: NAD-dependent epimerase/dehydratase family protein [Candidatus Limnocylindrales bacterium]